MKLKAFISDKGLKLILACAGFLVSGNLQAQDSSVYYEKYKWWKPAHIQLQFAGNIGFLSGGLGFSDKKKSSTSISPMALCRSNSAE
jgi:hypothetical protein